jgi:hypothetical protein
VIRPTRTIGESGDEIETFAAFIYSSDIPTCPNRLHGFQHFSSIDSITRDFVPIDYDPYHWQTNHLLRLNVGCAWNGAKDSGNLIGLSLQDL